MWIALIRGLVDQQVSDDAGGDRGTGLVEEAVAMFLAYCQPAARTPASGAARPEGALL
jgi:hypothetical protein